MTGNHVTGRLPAPQPPAGRRTAPRPETPAAAPAAVGAHHRGLVATFLVIVAWSVGNALTVPGGGTVSDRLAEWARDHYLGPVVTFGEWLTYRAPRPRTGDAAGMREASSPPGGRGRLGPGSGYGRVLLFGGTSEIGQQILAALRLPPEADSLHDSGGRAAVVWVPPQLGPLAAALRLVPRPLWRRLRR
jgi:hypothetical protein